MVTTLAHALSCSRGWFTQENEPLSIEVGRWESEISVRSPNWAERFPSNEPVLLVDAGLTKRTAGRLLILIDQSGGRNSLLIRNFQRCPATSA